MGRSTGAPVSRFQDRPLPLPQHNSRLSVTSLPHADAAPLAALRPVFSPRYISISFTSRPWAASWGEAHAVCVSAGHRVSYISASRATPASGPQARSDLLACHNLHQANHPHVLDYCAVLYCTRHSRRYTKSFYAADDPSGRSSKHGCDRTDARGGARGMRR
ncbi:hypothetical protein E2C01_055653 [Portunus trituberculatus]|uniref:Uncharacterized protein n=1 Tax=Portunus trituberculatus TaxID=210409 RepID=A0A5B7GXH8_PORTR|nr:hypothetical protein [Portunus trituberculatus]